MQRHSDSRAPETSVHAIGNGNFLIYGLGADLLSVIGPSYSAPSYCSGKLLSDGYVTDSVRLDMTDTWVHTITYDDGSETVFTDAIDPEYNIFYRKIVHVGKPVRYKLDTAAGIGSYEYNNYNFDGIISDCTVLVMKKGHKYFTDESLKDELRMYILCVGEVSFDAAASELVICGSGGFYLVSGKAEDGQAFKHACRAATGIDILSRSAEYYGEFLSRAGEIPDINSPELNNRVKQMLQSVAVLIKAQQSSDGGVTAGHFYPMAYVRDQSGVMRGLLAMGYVKEAAAVIDFWYGKFTRFGNLHNAESMGHDNCRLCFSNDEVEVPAFVLLCCMLYLEKTGDNGRIAGMLDMLNWCFTVQIKHIAHGMTGFSGDETYIAGNIFPREFLYHGSADSTLLFAESGKRFIDFARENRLLPLSTLDMYAKYIDDVRSLFKDNFFIDGILHGNNPDRVKYVTQPRFHYGFCMAHQIKGLPAPLMWLERNESGLFCCPECFNEQIVSTHDPEKRYILGSTALLPVYFKSDLLSYEEIKTNAEFFFEIYDSLGYIPSEAGSTNSLGYDLGLLLYNAVFLGDDRKDKILDSLLDMLDSCGAWAEYYNNGAPFNCRCRPWESAINTESVVYYCRRGIATNAT